MKVVASKCQILSSATSLRVGLKIMEETETSYLLLRNEDEVLSGIFTKSDLLRISVQLEADKEIFSRPLHQFMTKPVKTIPLELINTAPEFLSQHKIAHVPVTSVNSETDIEEIAGIITKQAIFDAAVENRGILPIFIPEHKVSKRKKLGVMGIDGSIYSLFNKLLSNSPSVDVERFRFANFKFEKIAESVDALVLDIDDVPERIWLPLVKSAMENAGLETVFLAFTAERKVNHSNKLEKIASSGIFKVFHKPVDISVLFNELEKVWLKK